LICKSKSSSRARGVFASAFASAAAALPALSNTLSAAPARHRTREIGFIPKFTTNPIGKSKKNLVGTKNPKSKMTFFN